MNAIKKNLLPQELRHAALFWLAEKDAACKATGTRLLAQSWVNGNIVLDRRTSLTTQSVIPGQPIRPELVHPLNVKRRAMNSLQGRAVLIHALAHIEFNAINLALMLSGASAICRATITPTGCWWRGRRRITSRC